MKIVIYILLYILMGCVYAKEQVEFFPDRNFRFSTGWAQDDFFGNFAKELDVFLSNHEVQIPGRPKKVVVFNTATPAAMKKLLSVPKEDRILVIMEPPSVCKGLHDPAFHALFKTVITWDDATLTNDQYRKYHYPVLREMLFTPRPFEEKKLCTSISANKHSSWPGELYTERRKAIDFFSTKVNEFDMYGVGWEGEGISSYRGPIEDKIQCMSQYRFSICYENTSDALGYVTEKIFDSFAAGCVPVYLGAPNINEYVPEGCYIDKRKFPTYEALYSHLKNMGKEEYNRYIENIKKFLSSDQARMFTFEKFREVVTKACLDE